MLCSALASQNDLKTIVILCVVGIFTNSFFFPQFVKSKDNRKVHVGY